MKLDIRIINLVINIGQKVEKLQMILDMLRVLNLLIIVKYTLFMN